MSDTKTPIDPAEAEEAARESDAKREAVAEGESAQDFDAESEAAESRTAFGDDRVTPRLNDGR